MNKPEPNRVRDARHSFDLTGAMPLGNSLAPLTKPLRVKVFKSGNSLAVRMPKALGLEAGMELLTEVLPDGAIVLRKAEAVRKKLDISGFWGKAKGLKVPERRDFEVRPSDIATRLAKGEM
jgi:antitoxin VapB